MRSKLYTMVRLLGTGSLFVSLAASADVPAQGGARWDDSHMQSNFARQIAAPTPHRVVVGATRFEENAPDVPTRVEEQTLAISPHAWQAGEGRPIGGSAPRWAASREGSAPGFGARAERGSNLRGSVSSSNGSRSSRF